MPGSVFAAVEITQVMYDVPGTDAGREWVTVTNKGTASVDISKFKFLEGGVNHKLILTSGSALLSSGGSAIIASNAATFLSEHPGFVGAVFKSSFSLSNTGETIALINDTGAVEHSHTYIAQKKAPAASKSKKTSAKTSSIQYASSSPAEGSQVGAVASPGGFASSGMLPWLLGLGGIVALGVAGVFLLPLQAQGAKETRGQAEEFEIVDN